MTVTHLRCPARPTRLRSCGCWGRQGAVGSFLARRRCSRVPNWQLITASVVVRLCSFLDVYRFVYKVSKDRVVPSCLASCLVFVRIVASLSCSHRDGSFPFKPYHASPSGIIAKMHVHPFSPPILMLLFFFLIAHLLYGLHIYPRRTPYAAHLQRRDRQAPVSVSVAIAVSLHRVPGDLCCLLFSSLHLHPLHATLFRWYP